MNSSRVRGRSRFVSVVVSVALACAGLLVTGGPAHAEIPAQVSLPTAAIKVTTSTGVKVYLSIDVVQVAATCSTCDDAHTSEYVSLVKPGGKEFHTWQVDVDGPQITPPTLRSAGAFDSRDNLKSAGRVAFSITPISDQKSVMCGSRIGEVRQKAKITGTIFLDTQTAGAAAWGTIGTSATPLAFSTTSRIAYIHENDCLISAKDTCSYAPQFSVNGDSGAVFGDTGKGKRSFFFSHSYPMPGAETVQRADVYIGKLGSAKLQLSGAAARVTIVGNGGLATGSGTIIAVRTSVIRTTCGPKHTKIKLMWYSGTFQNGAHPFTIHSPAFGDAGLLDGDQASIFRIVKR